MKELGYDGFERLRLVFDRVFGENKTPTFEKTLDAGCGTGLAGEQVGIKVYHFAISWSIPHFGMNLTIIIFSFNQTSRAV